MVITPMNKLPHANPTKAELGTEKTKLAGYIKGIAEKLTTQNVMLANKSLTKLIS